MINKKKTLMTMGLVAFTAASLFADDQNGQPMAMQRPPQQQITPNAAPTVTDGAEVFIMADFIWWKPRQDGLEYAASGIAPVTLAGNAPLVGIPSGQGAVYRPAFKYQPGFKVGIGLDLGHDGWDLLLNYTWLRQKATSTSVTRTGSVADLEPLWQPDVSFGGTSFVPIYTALPSSASGSWKFNLNVLDLDMGRNFYISKYLTLRPHYGLKGSWQTQRYSIAYSGIAYTPAPTDTVSANDAFSQKYWGVGARGGLDTSWYFCKEFSIYGNLSLTAMWSRYKDTRLETGTQTLISTGVSNTATLISISDKFFMITPVIEWSLGLCYETWFHNDNYHFAISAGYEEQIWGNMNRFFNEGAPGDHGNLSLDGLTLHARFDF